MNRAGTGKRGNGSRNTPKRASRSRRTSGTASKSPPKSGESSSQSSVDEAFASLDQLRASIDQLRKLQLVTDAALANLTVDDLLDELLVRVREALSSDTAAILLLAPGGTELVARAAKGLEEEVEQGVRIPVGGGFAGTIASTNQPVEIFDVDHSDVLNPILREKGVRSLLGVPLVVHDELLGVMHVGTLTPRRFTEDERGLLQLVGDRVALAINAGMYEHERAVARTLQLALLPDALPIGPSVRLAGRYLPAPGGDIGGDWYDAFLLPDGSMAVAVGDVVGRGLPAASIMAKLRNALRAYALEASSPGDALGRMNRLLMHLEPDQIATVFYGTIDTLDLTFRFASAGHLPPLIREPDGTVRTRWIEAGPPLGTPFSEPFVDNVEQLDPGTILVLYTDGLVERRDRSIDEGLLQLSKVCSSKGNADELCGLIVEEMAKDRETDDDLTLLVIEFSDVSIRN